MLLISNGASYARLGSDVILVCDDELDEELVLVDDGLLGEEEEELAEASGCGERDCDWD